MARRRPGRRDRRRWPTPSRPPRWPASRPTASGCGPCSPTPRFAAVAHGTRTFEDMPFRPPTVEVLAPGRRTSPCRTGPAGSATGPWACRRAGRWTTGRSASATGPSATPRARRGSSARCTGRPCGSTGRRVVCLAGADMGATLDGAPVERWAPVAVAAGSDPGLRARHRPGGPRLRAAGRRGRRARAPGQPGHVHARRVRRPRAAGPCGPATCCASARPTPAGRRRRAVPPEASGRR